MKRIAKKTRVRGDPGGPTLPSARQGDPQAHSGLVGGLPSPIAYINLWPTSQLVNRGHLKRQ